MVSLFNYYILNAFIYFLIYISLYSIKILLLIYFQYYIFLILYFCKILNNNHLQFQNKYRIQNRIQVKISINILHDMFLNNIQDYSHNVFLFIYYQFYLYKKLFYWKDFPLVKNYSNKNLIFLKMKNFLYKLFHYL